MFFLTSHKGDSCAVTWPLCPQSQHEYVWLISASLGQTSHTNICEYTVSASFYPSDLSTYSSRHQTAYIIKSCVYVGEQKVLTEQTFWLSLPLSLSIPKQELKCLFFSIVSVCLSNECRRHIWCLKQLYRRVVLCELHLVIILQKSSLSLGEAVKEFGKITLERHCNVRLQAL